MSSSVSQGNATTAMADTATRSYVTSSASAAVASSWTASSDVSLSLSTSITPRELLLDCGDGVQLAAQSWSASSDTLAINNSHKHRILCVHGWLDNCRSFHLLAPALASATADVEVVALDMVGHGWSSHKSLDGPAVVLAEAVYFVAQALEQLKWIDTTETKPMEPIRNDMESLEINNKKEKDININNIASGSNKVTLIGHSFGAAVSCLYAAAFPDQVSNLVLLDGIAPFALPSHSLASQVRKHVQKRMSFLQNKASQPRIYPSLEAAVRVRCQTARNSPGNQYVSETTARELVLRGSRFIDNDGRLQFRHDPRLHWPSITYLTPEQTLGIYDDLRSSDVQTCLLTAQDGWPFFASNETENASTRSNQKPVYQSKERILELLQPDLYQTLPGSHHFHSDPDTADRVAQTVIEFLQLK